MMSQASWLLLLGLASFANSVMESSKVRPYVHTQETFVDQCTPVPTWTIGGDRAISLIGQNITVIALLNSSRPFGRQQAAMLNLLRNRFYLAGFPAINFMVINSMLGSENSELLQHEAPSIPVYQEQSSEPVKDILGVGNDHILVLDRCGRIAYQVISPFSKLTHPYVKAAILSTYKDNPCGLCKKAQNVTPVAEEGKAGQTLASDTTDLVQCQFKVCNDHKTDLRLYTGQESNANGNETNTKEAQRLQEVTKERENGNGLPGSFKHNTEASESQEILQMHNTTLNLGDTDSLERSTEPRKRDQKTSEPEGQKLEVIANGEHVKIYNNSQMPKPEDGQSQLGSQDYLGHIKNWDWSENQNQSIMSGGSIKSTEQSVEVVHQENHSKEKKKRKKRKRKGKGTPAYCASLDCSQSSNNDLLQNSNSYEASDTSMEKLVNETQKLFDWYQQQIENGEEEYERTNILKVKIIDHYRKLLPWLNFKLAPKADNSQA
ncbi:selenoprotein P-like [Thrips palmi]|uniref:Selenoprotein P-like n=1 Tax=Thrips palmi TaxID=161013 RepID=A0A6P9ADR7_THRPL|nr:selenoprotein P-like [Thrips palmi]